MTAQLPDFSITQQPAPPYRLPDLAAPVPDISIEVDDVDAVYQRAMERGCAITYPLTDEDWGVRRFYLKDPAGKLLNVLSHQS